VVLRLVGEADERAAHAAGGAGNNNVDHVLLLIFSIVAVCGDG
jgi:hypothetical protein